MCVVTLYRNYSYFTEYHAVFPMTGVIAHSHSVLVTLDRSLMYCVCVTDDSRGWFGSSRGLQW